MDLPTLPDGRFWLDRLKQIFSAMDEAYDRAAAAGGFHCTGCQDNCCTTRFYHHTLLEYYYIKEGLGALSAEARRLAGCRAEEVCLKISATGKQGAAPRLMCPLNLDGRCIVYVQRPMICRLHGIAHELRRPDGRVVRGPGCEVFSNRGGPKKDDFLDRTPFYRDIAALEGELRRAAGFSGKIRMTVAQMVREICGPEAGATAARPPERGDDEIP